MKRDEDNINMFIYMANTTATSDAGAGTLMVGTLKKAPSKYVSNIVIEAASPRVQSIRMASYSDFTDEKDPGIQLLVASKLEAVGEDEKKGCCSEPEDIQDLVFFFLLLVIGLVLFVAVYGTDDFKALLAALLGENLFTAGMIPLLTVGYKMA